MRHEAEQFELWGDDLFQRAELVPGTIVRLIWREPGRKPRPGPHRYRVLSPTLYYLLSGRDPDLSADWEIAQVSTHLPLLAVSGLAGEMGDSGDYVPMSVLFWRKRDAETAGY